MLRRRLSPELRAGDGLASMGDGVTETERV